MRKVLDAHRPGWHNRRMSRAGFAVACSVLAASGAAVAIESVRPSAGAGPGSIESCVDRQPIRFRADERRVVLDAADAATVSAALIRRYPMLEQDGLAPQRIVLWRKAGADWIYIALLENPTRPAETCFTATFVAGRFDVTRPLIVKYFGSTIAGE
jgi:hypothetical protein